MSVRIEMLGEMKVWNDDQLVAVTADKQRTILAVLIAARGLDVSVDRLLDLVWETSQPSGGRSALRFHISKLRSVIQPGVEPVDSVVQTTATGYRLDCDRVTVDAWTLEARVERCSLTASEQPVEAIETLGQVVDSYGLYLGDFAYGEFAQQPRRDWDEYVISTALRCADLLVSIGSPDDAVALLQPMLEANPYRETIASKLVLALHGAERHVEALRTYDHVREELAEVGVDPGPELRTSLDMILSTEAVPHRHALVRHNLPVQIDRIVGRDGDLALLSDMLAKERYVRVAGLPGVGKSSLVASLARGSVDSFSEGVIWIDPSPSVGLDGDLARIMTTHFGHPVDPGNAAVTVSSMNWLVVIDEPTSHEHATPFVCELLSGTAAKVIVISNDAYVDAQVFTVRPLQREEAWSLFESIDGAPSAAIDGPDALMDATGGLPALIRFGAAVSKAEAHDVLLDAVSGVTADLLDSALDGIDERSIGVLAAVSAFSGPVSLLDVGGVDEEMALSDVMELIDGGWLISTPEGVEVPATVRRRLKLRGLVDQRALHDHARLVSSWPTGRAVRRFVDAGQSIACLAEADIDRAVEFFDRTARPLWDAGRYRTIACAARAILNSDQAVGSRLDTVLFFGVYAGLRTGDIELSEESQRRFGLLSDQTGTFQVEASLLAADVAWFEGRAADAATWYATANGAATSKNDQRAVLGAFGEAIVHAYTDARSAFDVAKDRVIAAGTESNEVLVAEVFGIGAMLAEDFQAAERYFDHALTVRSSTDRRPLQRRLLESHLAAGNDDEAAQAWAEIDADVTFTGVPLDPPTLFAGAVYHHRFDSAREATRLLHRGARSLRSSPAALWALTGLATAAIVGRSGRELDRVGIALARLTNRTGIRLLPPFQTTMPAVRGPLELDEVIELLLATEAPTR